jgi:hypothetical protein
MTSRRISPFRALLVILSLLLPASLAVSSGASAAANADFRGHWVGDYCGWVITTEDFASGAVTGTSDCTQFQLTAGQVNGNSYSFTVTDGSYFSYNTGTFTATTATGHFNDTVGHSVDYTATRASGPSATTLACAPDGNGGAVDTCTVTVSAQPADPSVTATGTVSFTSTGNGALTTASCTLAGTGGTATCTVPYDLLGGTQTTVGLPVVTAAYGGDAHLGASTGNTTVQYVALSGVVDATDCSAKTCRYEPIPGQVIHVDGGGVSQSAPSAKDGSWVTQVPPGKYVVKPTDPGFVPDSSTISVASNTSQLDFAVCSSLSAATGTAAQALVAAAGSPPSHLGCPDAVDWKMPPRVFNSTADLSDSASTRGLPKADFVTPSSWKVLLHLQDGVFPMETCPKNETYKWVVTPPTGAKVILKPNDGCSTTMKVSQLGTYTVTAQRYVQTAKGLKKTSAKPVTSKVKVDDLLIVGMGDSNASGEGLGPFYYKDCNRGEASYQYQAALQLERKMLGHTSVTFVSAACSGARTQHLVGTDYTGISDNTVLQPQIGSVEALLDDHGNVPKRTVSAVMMSIGINNIGFGPLLSYCVFHPPAANGSKPCNKQSVEGVPDGTGGVKDWAKTKTGKNLNQSVLSLIHQLPPLYDDVAASLGKLVSPKKVYLSQYPTEVYGTGKTLCDGTNSPFPQAVWAWLLATGDTLNRGVTNGAKAEKWNVLTVPDQDFYGHGYCQSPTERWFVPLTTALHNGNKAGAFHATRDGATVTANVAVDKICPAVAPDKSDCAN